MGGAGDTINNKLYKVFADSLLSIDIEVDMEQIEYDGVPIGKVYHVPDDPGFNKTSHGATYKV